MTQPTSPTRACFAVEATFADNPLERRAPHRAEHLARIVALMQAGTCRVAGAYDDLQSALLVFDVDAEPEARRLIEDDVYWKHGVWKDYRVRKLNRVVT